MHTMRLTPLLPIAVAAALAGCGDSVAPGTGPVATVALTPAGPLTLEVGEEAILSVTLRDAGGGVLTDRAISIRSSAPAVVKFEDDGFIIGVAEGTAAVTATSEGVTDTLAVTVVRAAVATVSVAPARLDIWADETQALVAVARDARNRTLPGRVVTWTSQAPGTATVTNAGLVTGVAPGTAMITAESEGISTEAEVLVLTPVSVAAASAGATLSCSITSTGTAYCWGGGNVGQLGVGSADDESAPRRVSGARLWQMLAGSADFACGIATAGSAHCWGSDFRHRLGNDTVTNVCGGSPCRTEPGRAVVGGRSYTQVVTGLRHACAIGAADSAAYCWGDHASNQLGSDDQGIFVECGQGQGAVQCSENPILVEGGLRFVQLAAGDTHTCGRTDTGDVWCWGSGGSGRLGNGSQSSSAVPVQVAGGLTFVDLGAGSTHNCGLASDGTAHCWGSGGNGALGTGGTANQTSPAAVTGGHTFTALAAGGSHTCGIRTDGAAFCWGSNSGGQLGTGGQGASASSPVQVTGGLTFDAVRAGGEHSCGLTTGGLLYCWGANGRGQVGVASTAANILAPARVLGQN